MTDGLNRVVLNIAGTVFSLEAERPGDLFDLDEAFREFSCADDPNVGMTVSCSTFPETFPPEDSLKFAAWNRWGLYQVGDRNVFLEWRPHFDSEPTKVMIFDRDFCRGEVFFRHPRHRDSLSSTLPNPLDFPLGEALMVSILGRDRGVMIHACGVDDGGRGYLFAGNSGHGKTTIGRLWEGEGRVLNDDRVVVREMDGRFWMFATPWHGDITAVSPKPVPLDKVFFLNQGNEHQQAPVTGIRSSTALLTRAFPPLWDEEAMTFTLDFFARLTSAVPCYELTFARDSGVVGFVRCIQSH